MCRFLRQLLSGIFCCVVGLAPLRADSLPPATEAPRNAALIYWQAFALLPDLNEKDSQLLVDAEQGKKSPAETEPLLGLCQTAIQLLKHVQPEMTCDWGLIERGPATLLPHLAKARLLARLLTLQAQQDVQSGNPMAAVNHLGNALVLSRNVADGTLIQLLVGDAIEKRVTDTSPPLLPTLDAPALERLSQLLEHLPPRPSFADAIRKEQAIFVDWLRPLVTADLEQAGNPLQELGINRESPEYDALLSGSREERMQRVDELNAAYNEIIEVAGQPNALEELKRIEDATQASPNPLVRLLLPASTKAYDRHTEAMVRFGDFQQSVNTALQMAKGQPTGK